MAGWLTAAWNAGWLVALAVGSPTDIYYPALHLVMPIPIGIALLRSPTAPAVPTS